MVTDQKIVSERYLDLIQNDGNPKLLGNSRFAVELGESIRHNVYQWDRVYKNGDFFKKGWAGQGLYISPDRDLVAAYVGYFKDDEHSEVRPLPQLIGVLDGVFQ